MFYSQQVQTKKKTQERERETETDGEREREREANEMILYVTINLRNQGFRAITSKFVK